MKGIWIVFIHVVFLASIKGQPKNLNFHHLTRNEGLPYENLYYMIMQDYEGFIWFASDNGLHKYDGYEFTSYYNDQNDSTSITGRSVRCLLEDFNKSLWVGCIGGLSIYNRDLNNFSRMPLEIKGEKVYIFDTRTLFETADKKLYIGISDDGIFEYNRSNNTIEQIAIDIPGFDNNDIDYINTLIVDKNNCFWIGTDNNGLFKLDIDNKKFVHFTPDSDYKLSSFLTFSVMQDSQGYFWVATDRGINKVNPITLETTIYQHKPDDSGSLSFNMVWRAYEDPNSNLWICTDGGGLNLYDRTLDRFIHFKHDKESRYSIAGDKLNSLFTDNQNNLYINVLGHGFSITNISESESFVSYVHSSDPKKSIGFNMINTFTEDKNENLWIGTDGGGLDFFDRKNNTFTHYKADIDDPYSLPTNTIVSLCIDQEERLWVGTYKGGLCKFNKKNNSFHTYLPEENNLNSISNDDIRGIIEDENGNLILATCGGGVNVFDIKKDKFTHYLADPNKENTLCDNYCQTIYQDSEGIFWIGTYYGLSRWDKTNDKFTTFLHNPDDSNSINDFIIFSIYEDKNKNLWFGTTSGLNSYNRETESFSNITVSNNAIFGIKDDNQGNLWLATENGIIKYLVETNKIIRFQSQTGLQGQNFKPGANYKTKSGEILFGGNQGFVAFYPEKIKKTTYKSTVLITDFQILNVPVSIGEENSPLEKHISRTRKLTLNYNENYISFKYLALNFCNTKQIKYAYKLEGFDNEWHFVGTERKATYSNISPGLYKFRVATVLDDNVISEEQTSLQIRILSPWWETIWFKTFIVFLVIIILVLIYYIRINTLEKQKALLDKLVTLRTREVEEKNKELSISNNTKDKLFSIIAHDLKNPFANILGFSELLLDRFDRTPDEKKFEHIKILNESAERIFNLLENLLQWAGSQSGRIKYNPEKVSLIDIVESNLSIFQPQMHGKNISSDIEISDELFLFTDKNMIHTIIRNLLSNAIKFSNENGKIKIKAVPNNNYAEITIKDNGIGIPKLQTEKLFVIDSKKSRQGTNGEVGSGLGLVICKEFIKRNKGDIKIESEEGKGTAFIFTIPLHANQN